MKKTPRTKTIPAQSKIGMQNNTCKRLIKVMISYKISLIQNLFSIYGKRLQKCETFGSHKRIIVTKF